MIPPSQGDIPCQCLPSHRVKPSEKECVPRITHAATAPGTPPPPCQPQAVIAMYLPRYRTLVLPSCFTFLLSLAAEYLWKPSPRRTQTTRYAPTPTFVHCSDNSLRHFTMKSSASRVMHLQQPLIPLIILGSPSQGILRQPPTSWGPTEADGIATGGPRIPGTRCPTCALAGKEVWVSPGRCCGYCGTPCDSLGYLDRFRQTNYSNTIREMIFGEILRCSVIVDTNTIVFL
ncbi:hypothetical protein E4U43_001307 [Claviceps pusilla]|uniref:Uncharacterized protein n=1 Tax=Claviceps pusilla TaxID=123648 RepID=A0A9P7SW17_9HYPO|nr:hypothetical protein E4U43_001307 [Claviceps pusilla]